MAPTLERGLLERGQHAPTDWRTSRRKASLRDRLGKRFVPTLVGIGLVPVLAVAGLHFFAQAMSYESTDDAFIDAHTVDVAPKIAGRIKQVFIDDNWRVKKGDPIVEIDPRDYDAQLRQKHAAVDSTKAHANYAQSAVEQQIANVKSLQATLDQNKADQQAYQAQADQTADNLHRQQDLYNNRVVSVQDLITAKDSDRSAQANLDAAKMKVVSAEAQLVEGQAQVRTYEALLQYVLAQVKANQANTEAAQLNDSYTKVFAPESGRANNKSVEQGDYAQVGQNVLALGP